MILTLNELAAAAMQLPAASRAELAEKLVESLDFLESDEHQSIWISEAERRIEDVRSGRVEGISGDEVMEEARRIVGR